jgi:hypothetical protein
MPADVREAVLFAADVCPYPGQVGEGIAAYADQGHPDMALNVFRAHAVMCLVDLLFREFDVYIMREGLGTEGWAP